MSFHDELERRLYGAGDTATDVTGIEEWSQSDTARELRDRKENSGPLGSFDASARAGFDFLLDNPNASVQDSVRGGVRSAGETIAGEEAEDSTGEVVARGFDRAEDAIGESVEGTALDNPVTDGVAAAGDFLLLEPGRAAAKGLTGIDTGSGDEEGTVGAAEAFDVGVTIGTAGLGRAAGAAVRGGAKSGRIAGLLGRGGDDAARGADEAADAGRAADEAAPALPAGRGADDAAGATDDAVRQAARGSDEASQGARSVDDVTQASDEAVAQAARGADDAAAAGLAARAVSRVASRAPTNVLDDLGSSLRAGADEAGGLFSRAGRSADDAGRAGRSADDAGRAGRGADDVAEASDDAVRQAVRGADDAARGADDASSAFRNALRTATSTRPRQVATGTGALLAGGATLESLGAFDSLEVETENGETLQLVQTDQFRATEDYPNGAQVWEVRQKGEHQGYTVMLDVRGRNVILMDEDGSELRSKLDLDQFREAAGRGRGGGA